MDGVDRVDAVHVIIIQDSDVRVVEFATHDRLGILLIPLAAMPAGRDVRVVKFVTKAGRLELSASLHLRCLD